jgi:hypothetical protein
MIVKKGYSFLDSLFKPRLKFLFIIWDVFLVLNNPR